MHKSPSDYNDLFSAILPTYILNFCRMDGHRESLSASPQLYLPEACKIESVDMGELHIPVKRSPFSKLETPTNNDSARLSRVKTSDSRDRPSNNPEVTSGMPKSPELSVAFRKRELL